MPRGYLWCQYLLNDGTPFALRVDADLADDPARGWVALGPGSTLAPLPRGWVPRIVYGNDDTGAWRSCRVAHTGADLWVGTAPTFLIYGTDEAWHTVTVTGRRSENTRRRPH